MVDWKKEIKLSDLVGSGKKDETDAPADAAGETEQTSIWKKEISFGRRKQPKPAEAPSDEPAAVELVDAYVPPTEADPVLSESVAEPAPVAAAPEPAPAPAPVGAPAPLAAAPEPIADVVELLAG